MNPTAASTRLGQLLAEMRTEAGLTVRKVGSEMGYSGAKVTQQEKGYRRISRAELDFLVSKIYRGTPEQLQSMEYLRAKAEEPPGWWTETGAFMTEHFRTYLGLEADAELIETVALEIVPGLLQTESYVRQQADMATDISPELRERYVEIRLRRQERLTVMTLDVVLSESALWRIPKDSDQIQGLIDKAEMPLVTIRILPFDAGQHRVVGGFSILTLPQGTLPPVVYQGHVVGGTILDDRSSVGKASVIYRSLWDSSLDPVDSLDLMREMSKR